MKSRHYKSAEAEHFLKNSMAEIKQEDANLTPPPELQERLKASFQSHSQSAKRPNLRYRIAAVFLIFVLGGSIWILKKRELRQDRTQTSASSGFETTEEYLPLTYGFTPGESLQRVRVRLPRSALNQFGISLKPTSNQEITADLLVGESGVPYAIRVVQQN
jgi:hypothetical protein